MSPRKPPATSQHPSSPPQSPSSSSKRLSTDSDLSPKKKKKATDGSVQQYIGQYGVVDDSEEWEESTVPEDETIAQGKACKKYALEPQDIARLYYEEKSWIDRETGEPRIGHFFNEREVEKIARLKHTTPTRLAKACVAILDRDTQHLTTLISSVKALQEAEQERNEQPINNTSTQPPASHSGSQQPMTQSDDSDADASDEDATESPSPPTYSQVVKDLDALKADLQRHGRGWLYDVWSEKAREFYPDSVLDAECWRGCAVLSARFQLAKRYPPRPHDPASQSAEPSRTMREGSKSFRKLDTILAESNEPEPDATKSSPSKRGRKKFEWDDKYSDRVYGALYDITRAHGVEGWKEARWIVYDQYRKCGHGDISVGTVKGRNGKREGKWDDTAAFWLHFEEYKMGAFLKDNFSRLFSSEVGNG